MNKRIANKITYYFHCKQIIQKQTSKKLRFILENLNQDVFSINIIILMKRNVYEATNIIQIKDYIFFGFIKIDFKVTFYLSKINEIVGYVFKYKKQNLFIIC